MFGKFLIKRKHKIIALCIIVILGISFMVYHNYLSTVKYKESFANIRLNIKYKKDIRVNNVEKIFIISNDDNIIYLSPAEKHFQISGFWFLKSNKSIFNRLDINNLALFPSGVVYRASHTSGGRIRFRTNSKKVKVKVELNKIDYHPHMPLTGTAGIDVYIGEGEKKVLIDNFSPKHRFNKNYQGTISLNSNSVVQLTINLPLYSSIKKIEIGLENSSILRHPLPYSISKPIVFYGSSITQGASASRPGTSYPAIVTRNLDANLLNFGFSSSAKGELIMAKLIGSIDMSAFIMDYDHNAKSPIELRDTHYSFYKEIRKSQPDVPIIIISRISAGYSVTLEEATKRRKIIKDTYRKAISRNDNNVYFIDGSTLASHSDRDELLVDGVHPNELGMFLLANEIEQILHPILVSK